MDEVQMQEENPLHAMDSDQLLSAMILADRDERNDDFLEYRREVMYRLRCAEPLVNWSKPLRLERK